MPYGEHCIAPAAHATSSQARPHSHRRLRPTGSSTRLPAGCHRARAVCRPSWGTAWRADTRRRRREARRRTQDEALSSSPVSRSRGAASAAAPPGRAFPSAQGVKRAMDIVRRAYEEGLRDAPLLPCHVSTLAPHVARATAAYRSACRGAAAPRPGPAPCASHASSLLTCRALQPRSAGALPAARRAGGWRDMRASCSAGRLRGDSTLRLCRESQPRCTPSASRLGA